MAGIDHEHLAFLFAGYVHFAVCRVDGDAFRLGRYFYFAARLAGIEIDNQSAGIVFICDEREFSVFADCELFRVGSDMPAIDQLARHRIDHTETISALVSGRAIFVHAGSHSRRTAQRDKNSRPIRCAVNPAGSFADLESRDHVVRRAIDDTHITRSFVADEHKVAGGLRLSQAHDCTDHERRNSPEAESHSGSRSPWFT